MLFKVTVAFLKLNKVETPWCIMQICNCFFFCIPGPFSLARPSRRLWRSISENKARFSKFTSSQPFETGNSGIYSLQEKGYTNHLFIFRSQKQGFCWKSGSRFDEKVQVWTKWSNQRQWISVLDNGFRKQWKAQASSVGPHTPERRYMNPKRPKRTISDKTVKALYFNENFRGSLGSKTNFLKHFKRKFGYAIKGSQLDRALRDVQGYYWSKPRRVHFPRRSYDVRGTRNVQMVFGNMCKPLKLLVSGAFVKFQSDLGEIRDILWHLRIVWCSKMSFVGNQTLDLDFLEIEPWIFFFGDWNIGPFLLKNET